jgi:phage terminase large subunit-like protein
VTRPWHGLARPNQLPPADEDWKVFLINAGRGFGKTRAGAEWLAEQAATRPNLRFAVIAPTWHECRMLCFEGYSGILQALLPGELESSDMTEMVVRLTNGAEIHGYGTDGGLGRLTTEYDGAWAEEIGAWTQRAWDRVEDAIPFGPIFATASPYLQVVARLTSRTDIDVRTAHGSTFDNAENLSPKVLALLIERYGPDHPQVAGPS